MALKIALGLIAVNIDDASAGRKIYIVSSESIGQDEMETIRKELQIKEFVSQPAYSYSVKPEAQLDFENQLRRYTELFKTTSDDKNEIIYEIFGENEPTISENMIKDLKVKSLSKRNYYVFGVGDEMKLAFEKFLSNKGVPFRNSSKLLLSVPEVGTVPFRDFIQMFKNDV